MAPEKVFLEVARKLLEFIPATLRSARSHLAACSATEGASLFLCMDCNSDLMKSLIFWGINL